MTDTQQRIAEISTMKALAALDEMAAGWGREVELNRMVAAIAGQDDLESRIIALAKQAFIEGLYRARMEALQHIADLTKERDSAYERAALVADAYADANIELAGDSVLTDPLLRGEPLTAENVKASEARMVDGCVHSSMFHAAQNIAAAIRALPAEPKE